MVTKSHLNTLLLDIMITWHYDDDTWWWHYTIMYNAKMLNAKYFVSIKAISFKVIDKILLKSTLKYGENLIV